MKKPDKASETAAPGALSAGLRRYLFFTASVTGAAIMIVEILGARMLSPYVGTSHFVWTAQIAVTLVALAAGYAAGGWLVDRSPRLPWIYGSLVGAAFCLGLTVLGTESVAYYCLRFRLAAGSLLASLVLFFLPLALLAMVGPFFVRVLTVSVDNVGSNMGRLTAVSTLGSVVGTVLIGYVLIPHLPNATTMYLTAGVLVAVALGYFAVWARQGLAPALAGGLVGGFIGLVGIAQPILSDPDRVHELCRTNSPFGVLQVVEDRGGRRYYLNDLLTQNTYLPSTRQSDSLFTFMLHELARVYAPATNDVLCVGMGVGIVPMQFARAGTRVDLVEINPAVVPLARRYFDFDPALVNLHIGDGRYFVQHPARRYDAVVVDAFLGESPPAHLMTREAFDAMRRCLKPEGVLVMNTFGELGSDRDFFLASVERTLRAVFRLVRLLDGNNGNFFFVATDAARLEPRRPADFGAMPVNIGEWARATFECEVQASPGHGRVLTDDYNPVDVFDAANREALRRRLAMSYAPR